MNAVICVLIFFYNFKIKYIKFVVYPSASVLVIYYDFNYLLLCKVHWTNWDIGL